MTEQTSDHPTLEERVAALEAAQAPQEAPQGDADEAPVPEPADEPDAPVVVEGDVEEAGEA